MPWIDPGAEDGQRVPFIKTTVLDQVEGMGEPCWAYMHCFVLGPDSADISQGAAIEIAGLWISYAFSGAYKRRC